MKTAAEKFLTSSVKKTNRFEVAMTIGAFITMFFSGMLIGRNKRDQEWAKYLDEVDEEKGDTIKMELTDILKKSKEDQK